jgi:hypothetical protein
MVWESTSAGSRLSCFRSIRASGHFRHRDLSLERVASYHRQRPMEPLGYLPLEEFEEQGQRTTADSAGRVLN